MSNLKCLLRLVVLIEAVLAGPARAAPDLDPLRVNISGECRSAIVQGHYAYCEFAPLDPTGIHGGLRIFDVSDPTGPVPVSFYQAGAYLNGLAVAGGHAYLTAGGRLHVIDVSDPADPRLTGFFDSRYGIFGLVVAGRYAYLAGAVMQIVDVGDPTSPRLVGSHNSVGLRNLVVAGQFVYTAVQGGSLLEVLNVSDPSDPRPVGSYRPDSPGEVFVHGSHAYVGRQVLDISNPADPQFVRDTRVGRFIAAGPLGYTDSFGGLGILDLGDPGDPRLIGRYGAVDGRLLDVSDGDAYLAAGAGLKVMDISSFAPPAEWTGHYEPPVEWDGLENAFVSGTTAYTATRSGRFDVLDVSDPAKPQRLGGINGLGDIQSIVVAGDRAYLGISRVGMDILDVSDPTDVRRLGRHPIADGASDVALAGSHAFLVGSSGFQVVDVSDPAQPQRLWEDPTLVAFRVMLSGNHAYLLTGLSGMTGFETFDVSDPANPQPVGHFDMDSFPTDFCVTGDRAYLTGSDRDLQIVDLSDVSDPHLLGRVRGVEPGRVVVAGDRAFITGSTLQVVDVSDASNPRLLGGYETAGPTAGVTVSGSQAFVSYRYGMQILDLSVPPQVPMSTASRATPYSTSTAVEVAVSGDYAMVGNGLGGRFDLVDLRDPANPIWLSSYYVGSYTGRAVFSGQRVFLTGGSTEAQILDLSDAPQVRTAGAFRAGSTIWDLSVAAGHAHVATELGGVEVFDVGDPAAPRLVAHYGSTDRVVGLVLSDEYAYVWSESGVEVFDVSNPVLPQRIGLLSTNPLVNTVSVSGNYAYVGAGDGLEVFDVSDPASPSRVGGLPGGFGRVIVSGDHLISRGDGLEIYELSDPSQPRWVGSYRGDSSIFTINGFDVLGNHAFLCGYPAGDLHVVDLTRLANPQRVGSVDGIGESATRGGVSISARHAFVADGIEGVRVIDLGDESNPVLLGSYDTAGSAEDVFVLGYHGFVADWETGLLVLDVSDPARPESVATLALPAHSTGDPEVAERVVVAGHYAYVTGFALHVIDVSDPSEPVRVGGYEPPGGNLGISLSGEYAYLVTSGRFHVVDVSDPLAPRLVGYWAGDFLFPPPFFDVSLSGGFAYVAAGTLGVLVFDVRDPADPRLVGVYEHNTAFESGEDARSIHVVGPHAYVMDRVLGLYVLDVSDPRRPRRVGGNPALGQLASLAADLTVDGDKLHVLAGERGLVVLGLPSLRLEAMRASESGSIRFRLHGPPQLSGRVQRSGDLLFWEDWISFRLDAPPLELNDPAAASLRHRYYRALAP
jgi:hypothetical protein